MSATANPPLIAQHNLNIRNGKSSVNRATKFEYPLQSLETFCPFLKPSKPGRFSPTAPATHKKQGSHRASAQRILGKLLFTYTRPSTDSRAPSKRGRFRCKICKKPRNGSGFSLPLGYSASKIPFFRLCQNQRYGQKKESICAKEKKAETPTKDVSALLCMRSKSFEV